MTAPTSPPGTQHDNSFDLLSEPWIPVRFTNGTAGEISLRETFHRAAEIRAITGEIPTQSFALLRLLLAIMYRAHGERITTSLYSQWNTNGLPLSDIDEYLDEFTDRFNLFGNRPFFQVADLHTAKGDHKDVSPLIADLPSNNRLFTNRSGDGATSLSFSEAARWLIHAQAFDVSGIKSGAVGDPRVKGGKGYPLGVAWSGHLGGVYAQGETLHATLLLNLTQQSQSATDNDIDADIPPWEEEHPDGPAEREGLMPRGPVRLYTWQSRRIRLFAQAGHVTGCLVTNGDKLTPQNMQTWEPMTAWRYSAPQTKKLGQTTYMPREHEAGRALWRGISAILPGIAPTVPKADVASGLPPGVVDWVKELRGQGAIEASALVRLRAVGIAYGSQSSVVDDLIDDEVVFPLALLATQNQVLAAQASDAVNLADEGVRAVRYLVENLERAAGGTGEAGASWAMESAWAALDAPYRDWLAHLSDDDDPLDAIEEWKSIAHKTLRRIGAEAIAQAGPAAWVGREVSRLGRTDLVNTPRAEAWFLQSLTKTFGKLTQKNEAA